MKLNTLSPGKGFEHRKRWCGPSALAIITGRTLKHCHNTLAKYEYTLPRYMKGVGNGSMQAALREMGFEMEFVGIKPKTNLRQYIDEQQRTAEFRQVMLINVTDHYVVAHRGMIQDNQQGPVRPAQHRSGRSRVVKAWIIRRKRVN